MLAIDYECEIRKDLQEKSVNVKRVSYGDVTITNEGLQNLGLYSTPLSRERSLSAATIGLGHTKPYLC
jgi:hypothetical protein